MQRKWSFILLLFISVSLFANIAQPGIRDAGGTADFSLLFTADSAAYHKIQMQEERIFVQLYKGFAVVKGEYEMLNTTDQQISFKAGYPLNASFETTKNNSDLTAILFEQLYGFQVVQNGNPVDVIQEPIPYEVKEVDHYSSGENEDWYLWTATFAPESLTKIEVYFIVNTNNSNVREGYDGKDYNGFVYVLETGANWKPPIGKGTILVELMDGLTDRDIHGVSPTNIFALNEENNLLRYEFANLNPTRKDNIAITYHDQIEGFDFNEILQNKFQLQASVEQLSTRNIPSSKFEPVEFDSPFDLPSYGSTLVGILFILGISLPIILPILLLAFVAYWLYKRYSKKKMTSSNYKK